MTTFKDILDQIGVQGDVPDSEKVILNMVPRDYQIEGFKRSISYENLRFGLYDEAGVGKSFVSYMFGLFYALQDNKVIGIMPPVLLGQFEYEFHRMVYIGHLDLKFHVLREGPKKRRELFKQWDQEGWPDFLIMSYQMFKRANVPSFRYDVMIADEAHALKSAKSHAHKSVAEFLGNEGKKAFLAMTGTPIPKDPECAFGLVKLITPSIYRTKRSFDMRHLDKALVGKFLRTVGFRNLDELSRNLYKQARRVLAADVLPLDRPTIIEREVILSPAHRALYRQLVRERMLQVGDEMVDAVQFQALRMHCLKLATNPQVYTEDVISNRVYEHVDELLSEIGNQKVIIFAWFRTTIQNLAKRYLKLNPALIYGGSDGESNKIKFLEDKTCRLLIANPESGGVGLNLQDVCSTAIFMEPVSTPKSFEQGTARIHRSGQTKPVRVYIFRIRGTVSERLVDLMLERAAENKGILRDRQSILDELMPESEDMEEEEEEDS